MKKTILLTAIFFLLTVHAYSQHPEYARSMIDTLTMPDFYGRGYVNAGEKKAADFIAGQLKKLNVKPFQDSYFQPFTLSINTLPGDVDLKINGKPLSPATDFLVSPDAPSAEMMCTHVTLLNEKTLKTDRNIKKFKSGNYSNRVLVIDTGFKKPDEPELSNAPLILKINDKNLSWRVSHAQQQKNQVRVDIKREAMPQKIKKIELKIDARLEENYPTQNVVAYMPGKVYPDTFVVVGAHYDHLGMMGNKTCFPGANDNASGTAMVLDLARYFSDTAHMGKYSIAFIFFTAEEAGLLGSEYYTEHPLFPLKNIKFMLNLDMVGTGSDGIKVVNGSILTKEFELLKSINEQYNYLKTVSARGEAANSDHYFFYKNGVKSFFIYTLGDEYKEYHTTTDKAAGLPLTKYPELFKLVVGFIQSL